LFKDGVDLEVIGDPVLEALYNGIWLFSSLEGRHTMIAFGDAVAG
jgi:hypothetical protein